MKKSNTRKFCIGFAAQLHGNFYYASDLIKQAEILESWIIGDNCHDSKAAQKCTADGKDWNGNPIKEVTPVLPEKVTPEVFRKALYEKAMGDMDNVQKFGSPVPRGVANHYFELYIKDEHIFDVDYWIESNMRHLSLMNNGHCLRPIIQDKTVIETYSAQVQRPPMYLEVEPCVIIVAKTENEKVEISITRNELRLLLDATDYLIANKRKSE